MRRLPSKTQFVLNQQATVQLIAETDQQIWAPVLDPLPTRRFDIELVVDEGASMLMWQQVATEWHTLLEHHGAFRNVRAWRLTTDDRGNVELYTGTTRRQDHPHDPKELIDPSGRRLILVMTDCVSPAWHSGKVQSLLDIWGHQNLVSLIQIFPRRLWQQTSLANADLVQIDALFQHISNSQLKTQAPVQWFAEDLPVEDRLAYPVVTLEYRSLHNWARMITGTERTWVPGILFANDNIDEKKTASQHAPLSPITRVRLFHASASPTARKLIELLAAVPIPINLQVIQLIRHTMVPEASQVHIAEVMLSGLLEEIYRDPANNDFNKIEYDFVTGVREELLNAVAIPTAYQILRKISLFIEQHQGKSRDFPALITMPDRMDEGAFITHESRSFAKIASTVLRRYGGDFVTMAKKLEKQVRQLDIQPVEARETSNPKITISESLQTHTISPAKNLKGSNVNSLSATNSNNNMQKTKKEALTILKRLAQLLHMRKEANSRPYHLFLSSSISLTSSLMRQVCGRDNWSTFRNYLSTLSPRDRLSVLSLALHYAPPPEDYLALARLILAGHFPTVLTTNVDSALEDALDRVLVERGMRPHSFQALIVDHDKDEDIAQALTEQDMRIRIVKLHGSIRSGAVDWSEQPYQSRRGRWGKRIQFGTVLSGEKLVDSLDFRDQLRALEPEAIGGEMEGIGLYTAAQNAKVDWILVKAICDWADGDKLGEKTVVSSEGVSRKISTKNRNQKTAAQNAAQFTMHVLRNTQIV